MSLLITPTRVVLSNGNFDSDKGYIMQDLGGNFLIPNNKIRTLGANRDTLVVFYKNGIGNVPALNGYTDNPSTFRMRI